MKEWILGIDIGTSGCKTAAFHYQEGLTSVVTQSYPTQYPKNGWAQQNPGDWWNAAVTGIRHLLRSGVNPRQIAAVGVDGQGWDPVFLDRKGNVLTPTPIWQDMRSGIYLTEYNEQEKEDIFRVSGNPLQPAYATLKVRWIRDHLPLVYEQLHTLLLCSGFLVYCLTGEKIQDLSQAYSWHFYNIHKGTWDYDLAERFAVRPSMLPPLVPSSAIVGSVTEEAAALTGLIPGTPVIAGGLDAACANLGAGIIHDGQCQEQGGSAGGLSICSSESHASRELILSNHVIPGKYLLQGGTTGGGGVLRWIASQLEDPDGTGPISDTVYEGLLERASKAPAGSDGMVFLPYLSGERSPIWNPAAKGVWFGLDYAKSKSHLIRSAMEGVVYSVRHNMEAAYQAGCTVDTVRTTGGLSKSAFLCQMKADILGKNVDVCQSDTATVLGTAILAGVGAGLYRSYEEACDTLNRVKQHFHPDPEAAPVYEQGYRTYLSLYRSLEHLMK